jgi:hypothetical protein
MRRRIVRLTLLSLLIGLIAVPLARAAVQLASGGNRFDRLGGSGRSDDRSSPLKAKQKALLERALEQRLDGKTHDRAVDNVNIWRPDFNRSYYVDMLFSGAPGASSMHNYYIEQSSNRFTVSGDVTDWVRVPQNAAYYDDNKGGVDTTKDVWLFLRDSVDVWYDSQVAGGHNPAPKKE